MANFAIKLNKTDYLSLYQAPFGEYDMPTTTEGGEVDSEGFHTSEIALFSSGEMVGDPIRFYDADELADIIKQCADGDYTLFENQYDVTLDLFDDDDNIVRLTKQ